MFHLEKTLLHMKSNDLANLLERRYIQPHLHGCVEFSIKILTKVPTATLLICAQDNCC